MNVEEEKVLTDVLRELESICFSHELASGLIAKMLTDHPTHQQRFMAFVVAYIKSAANVAADGRYDLRNEAAAKFAMKVRDSKVLDDVYFPVI